MRRSFAVRALPVVVVVGLYALLTRGTPWAGEWRWTIDWATGTTALIAPLTAGVGAFEARSAHDVRRRLFDTTSRRRTAAAVPGLLALGVGVVAFAGVLLVAIVLTLRAGATPTDDLRLPLLGLVAIALAAAFGAWLGSTWPSILTAPLAAAAVFGAAVASGVTSFPAVLRVGGSTGTLAGLTTSSRFVLVIGAVSVLLALTFVLLTIERTRAGRLAAGVVGVVAVVALVGAWADPPQDLVVQRPALRCSDGTPVVCLASDTDRLLATLPDDLARASRPLRDAGLTPPDRFTQVLPGRTVRSGAPLYLESTDVNRSRLGARAVQDAFTTPRACPEDTGTPGPPEAVYSARATLAAWLAIQLGDARPRDFRAQPDGDWLARPEAQQRAWLGPTYRQLTACALMRVRAAPSDDAS